MNESGQEHRKGQATIIDVAALAGVSISTVSRVLNDSAFVEADKCERVRAAIAELGFQPKAAARALAGKRTRTIGLIVPEISGEFFLPMLRGIEAEAARAGYGLLIQTSRGSSPGDSPGTPPPAGRLLGEHNTDGLLVFSDSPDPGLVRELEASRVPAVILYSTPPAGSSLSSITVDSRGGARRAVDHLIEIHGRKRIACLTGPELNHDAEERRRGYEEALSAHGLGLDPALLVPGDFRADTAAASIRRLVAEGVAFDAVFTGDDGAALGVLSALAEAGLEAGKEVAVAGFDDQTPAAHSRPPLATVRAPTEELGARAVRLLVARMDEPGTRENLVLPTEFVPRASCGCAPTRQPPSD